MILAFFGGGKGKTSAALGVALRAWGHGMRVLYAGVMKTPIYMGEEVGEYKAMRKMGVDVVYLTDFGRPEKVFYYALDVGGEYDVVILDELLYAVRQGFIPSAELKKLKDVKNHVVATGGYWQDDFTHIFDLATEMREVKHYFKKGVLAIRGVDY
ncbi:MAG: cob(I)yrinic acid a,c-diamide adenosyltransferase [Pyrobaculum sp.]|jgi:cob(I)alamin adenosyltransferase